MGGTRKSEALFGNVGSDYLIIAPFGPAVPSTVVRLVQASKQAFNNGQLKVFIGPIRDNRGVLRVAEGQVLSDEDYTRMDWLAEGVIGRLR